MPCHLPVWPLPAKISGSSGVGRVIVDRAALMLVTTPASFQQETCRHFLARAFDRFKSRAFAEYSYEKFSLNASSLQKAAAGTSSPRATIALVRLSMSAVGNNDANLLSFCNYHGELVPARLAGSSSPGSPSVDESYSLRVTMSAFEISARSPIGVLRAFATLEQLVHWDGKQHIVTMCSDDSSFNNSDFSSSSTLLTITDAPRFPWRGLMLDTARHFYPMSALRRIVDGMEMLKLSVFHWHIVDAQSFPFVSTTHPRLSSEGAFSSSSGGGNQKSTTEPSATYSPDDVKQFVQYCADRGVRLIPEFDVPGHTASWGKGYPYLTVVCPTQIEQDAGSKVPMREHGIDRVAMHPLRNTTYEFLDSFFKEVFKAFPDSMLHIGGDEVNSDCWAVDPEISAWAAAHGPTWARQLQGEFEQRVFRMLHKGGKRAMVWDEVLDMPDATNWMTPGTIVHWWRGWVRGTPRKALQAGLDVVMSAPWYLDHVGDDWLKMYQANIDESLSSDLGGGGGGEEEEEEGAGRGKLLGGEACSWSEHANEANVEHRIFSRLPSVAERLWSPAAATTAAVEVASRPELARRLGAMLCGLRQRAGLNVGAAYPDFCVSATGGEDGATGEAGGEVGGVGSDIGDVGGGNGGKIGGVEGGGSDLEDALSSVRKWQFFAFSLGAVICFGCAAVLALFIARASCSKSTQLKMIAMTTRRNKTSRKARSAEKKGEKKKKTADENHAGGMAVGAGNEDDEEDNTSDDDRQGLLP